VGVLGEMQHRNVRTGVCWCDLIQVCVRCGEDDIHSP
jgi:hypothetical protein